MRRKMQMILVGKPEHGKIIQKWILKNWMGD
jgi:hypothetical protein